MSGKLWDRIGNIITVSFCLLMTGIVWATIVIDKRIPSLFPNTVKYNNVWYYLAAVCFGIGICFLSKKMKVSNRFFYVAVIFLLFAVALVQWWVSSWMLVPNSGGGDFGNVMSAAISLADGGNFQEFAYFKRSPNNANIAIFLSFLYRFFPNWNKIIFLGALFVNGSVIFTCLAIRTVSHNNEVSLLFAVVGEVLIALNWRAFLVYTDNFGMFFIALAIWIFVQKIDDRIKIPVFMFVAGAGYYIKVTSAVLLIAVAIYQLLKVIASKKKVELLKYLYGFVVLVAVFGAVIFMQGRLRRFYLLEPGEYAVGWQYMFMVGQNTDCFGVVNEADSKLYASLAEGKMPVERVKQACFDEAVRRIKSRGVGNITFYLRKLNVAYNDGYFHNVHPAGSYQRESILAEIYLMEGKYYAIFANVLQVLWDFLLLCIGIGAFKNRNEYMQCYALMILGITAYLMLFEGRSKYLFMFLPVFLATGGISFAEFVKGARCLEKRR